MTRGTTNVAGDTEARLAEKSKEEDSVDPSRRLARILADAELLSDEDLLTIQEQHPGEYLGTVLVRDGILLPSYLSGLLVRSLYIPWIAADRCTVLPEVAALLPEGFCRRRQLAPICRTSDFLTVASANPLDTEAIEEAHQITGLNVRACLCSDEELLSLIERTYGAPERDDTA